MFISLPLHYKWRLPKFTWNYNFLYICIAEEALQRNLSFSSGVLEYYGAKKKISLKDNNADTCVEI